MSTSRTIPASASSIAARCTWCGSDRSAEGRGLASVGRDCLAAALVVDEVQYVHPLAQLAGLRVPEPHAVADCQRVRGRSAQRRLDLAGAFGADQLEAGWVHRGRD